MSLSGQANAAAMAACIAAFLEALLEHAEDAEARALLAEALKYARNREAEANAGWF